MEAVMMWYPGRETGSRCYGVDGKDVQQVSQELASAGILIRRHRTVRRRVPAEMMDKARMEVAAKACRRRDGSDELFDKPNWWAASSMRR